MLVVQSINFVCTDFWSPYLLQMGAEIRVFIADVDSDPFLIRYWPPNTIVHRGSYLETDSSTMDKKAWTRTEKYGWTRMESVKPMLFGRVWPCQGSAVSAANRPHSGGSMVELTGLGGYTGSIE